VWWGHPLLQAERSCVEALVRVPGGFDQRPADVAVADFRDQPAALRFAGGVLGRDQPDKCREPLGGPKPAEIADLADEPERTP
jgi:hypothetical protein